MPTVPGFPRMTPPAYSVPAFFASSVAIGSAVTDVTLVSTAGVSEANKPFTFGQVFKRGEIAPSDFLVGRIAGEADIPLQFNPKATHPDGSVRHALISGVLPALGAGASRLMELIRSSTGTSTTPAASSTFTAGGFSAWANLYFGSEQYGANPGAALAANIDPAKAWIGGAIATEYSVMLPATAAIGGAEHPRYMVQFNIRFYPGANAAKVDITVEDTKAYLATTDTAYSGALRIGGVSRYSFDLTHFPGARWKKTLWWNNANPVFVKHNIGYLIDSKQVPNYDRRVTMQESALAGYATMQANAARFKPMGEGQFTPAMPGTGGRPDIGLLHGWAAAAVLSMDKRAVDITLAGGDQGGSWSSHLRDASTGPGAGLPLSAINWPFVTERGTVGDANNPLTLQNEKLPGRTTISTLVHDESHQPNFAYLPYLLTGDFFYLEELQFWGTWIVNAYNPGYRLWERGLLRPTQLRGQGWGFRIIGEAAAITPDTHPLKSHFKYWVDENFKDYNGRFTDNVSANQLGINDTDIVYGVGGVNNGTGVFQDDYFTQAVGHLAELGFTEANRLLLWKAKFQIGRMIAPGFCWIHAAMFAMKVRDGSDESSPIYTALAECIAATAATDAVEYLKPSVHALPCNSPARLAAMNAIRPQPSNAFIAGEMTGYAYGTEGYPSNYQPALAMAVDSGYTDGDLAWDLFDTRSVQPDYGTSPQFAIVPRAQGAAIVTAPNDYYQVASGLPIYGGRAAPVTTQDFDSLTFFNSSDGAPWSAQDGRPLLFDMHGSGGQNITNGRQYRAQVSGPMAYDTETEFKFSLVAATEDGLPFIRLRPVDWYGTYPGNGQKRESFWGGFTGMGSAEMNLITVRRMDALMRWAKANLSAQYDLTRAIASGGSMGGGGCFTWAIKHPEWFCAVYSDRGRPRYGYQMGEVAVPDWPTVIGAATVANSPNLSAIDGGGKFAAWNDGIAYAANTANKMPWLGWCIGRNDGYSKFPDHVALVQALCTAKRAFCFVWNDGDHATGSVMGQITASYPYGTFKLGEGYPYFTEHSLDKDPAVDLIGSINEGLGFRNVVETSSGWSCEVRSTRGACTVKVEPLCSSVFLAPVAAKLVTIPAANTWVPVSFTA